MNKKTILIIRISIYLTGVFIILWVIGFNVWQIKERTENIVQANQRDYFLIFNERAYGKASLLLNFPEEIPENLSITLEKDFSTFSTKLGSGVYTEKKLQAKFSKENPTPHPNGTFVNYQKKTYLIEDGELRELNTPKILSIFNLNKKDLPEISSENFQALTPGKPLTNKSISEEFPTKILIQKDDNYYISGTESYYPVFIPEIKKVIEKYNTQLIKLNTNLTQGKCYRQNQTQAICDFNLKNQKSNSGNAYKITIKSNNQPITEINQGIIKLEANPTLSEILEETKNLFVK